MTSAVNVDSLCMRGDFVPQAARNVPLRAAPSAPDMLATFPGLSMGHLRAPRPYSSVA